VREPYPNLLDHAQRLKSLERRLAIFEERLREHVNARRDKEDRDSSADLSMRPGRVRLSLKNLPPWVVALIVIALVVAVVLVGVIMRG
jgi:type VI protein secretion system component VasF